MTAGHGDRQPIRRASGARKLSVGSAVPSSLLLLRRAVAHVGAALGVGLVAHDRPGRAPRNVDGRAHLAAHASFAAPPVSAAAQVDVLACACGADRSAPRTRGAGSSASSERIDAARRRCGYRRGWLHHVGRRLASIADRRRFGRGIETAGQHRDHHHARRSEHVASLRPAHRAGNPQRFAASGVRR